MFVKNGAQMLRPKRSHRSRESCEDRAAGRCGRSAARVRGRVPLVVGPVSTEKGVPGDGDALLNILLSFYFVTVPHAIRSPALPAGSDFMSSTFASTTNAVPPLLKTE